MIKIKICKIEYFFNKKSISFKKKKEKMISKYILGVATIILSSQALLSMQNESSPEAQATKQNLRDQSSIDRDSIGIVASLVKELDSNRPPLLPNPDLIRLIPKEDRAEVILVSQQYELIRQFSYIGLACVTIYFGKELITYYFNSNRTH